MAAHFVHHQHDAALALGLRQCCDVLINVVKHDHIKALVAGA